MDLENMTKKFSSWRREEIIGQFNKKIKTETRDWNGQQGK